MPSEWRRLFESGDSELVATASRVCRRLLETLRRRTGTAPAPAAPEPAPRPRARRPPAPPTTLLLGGVAAAMALVKAHRTHGHLAARLDPLGSEPPATRRSSPSASIRR